MLENKKLLKLAKDWLGVDVDPVTRAEIQKLVDDQKYEELDKRLSNRIVFGTAGLRSRMEAGFSRINDVTILQASQGLAKYILDLSAGKDEDLSVVIGHDHRYHSERYADLTAAAFLHYGFKVYYLGPGVIATPVVPFSVDHFKASAGVMITSSHNPKDDNGYKVYWKNGCQIIPPHDKGIQKSIIHNLKPFFTDEKWDTESVFKEHEEELQYCKVEVVESYIQAIKEKLITGPVSGFQAVYTPMHGVGYEFAARITAQLGDEYDYGIEESAETNEASKDECETAADGTKSDEGETAVEETSIKNGELDPQQSVEKASAGVDHNDGKKPLLVVVPEQKNPDPDFPTVSFPNPEEKGALDLAISTAEKAGISLVVANDPDADRFSVAVKERGVWKQLTGNEIGFLFAYYIAKKYSKDELDKVYMVNSTVSSQMIASVAEKMGFHHEETLTGFKWIGNKAIDLEKEGFSVPFGFEEAIGFMFSVSHDKDGISALAVFLQMYQELRNKELSISSVLNQGYKKFGFYSSCNGYYRTTDKSIIPKIFDETIRQSAFDQYPRRIGDYAVLSWRDLTVGFDSSTKDHQPVLPIDPSSQMITCTLQGANENERVRFTARGSGTEPKLKVYIEAKSQWGARSKKLAKAVWEVLKRKWFRPGFNDLSEVCQC